MKFFSTIFSTIVLTQLVAAAPTVSSPLAKRQDYGCANFCVGNAEAYRTQICDYNESCVNLLVNQCYSVNTPKDIPNQPLICSRIASTTTDHTQRSFSYVASDPDWPAGWLLKQDCLERDGLD